MRGDPRTTWIRTACRFVMRRAERSDECNLPRRRKRGISFAPDRCFRLWRQGFKLSQNLPNYDRFEKKIDALKRAVEMSRRRESDERAALLDRAPEQAGEGRRERHAAIGTSIERRNHGIEPLAVARDADGAVAGEGKGSRQRQSPLLQRRGV